MVGLESEPLSLLEQGRAEAPVEHLRTLGVVRAPKRGRHAKLRVRHLDEEEPHCLTSAANMVTIGQIDQHCTMT